MYAVQLPNCSFMIMNLSTHQNVISDFLVAMITIHRVPQEFA